jgi:hypothetical protein
LGGLLAGLASNVLGIASAHFLFAADVEALLRRLGVTLGGGTAALHVGMRFAVGVGVVWLYAAIRPRFGAGPRTAMRAGLAMWLATFVFSFAGIAPYGLYAEHTLLLATVWTFFEMQAVTLLGAWLYKEQE